MGMFSRLATQCALGALVVGVSASALAQSSRPMYATEVEKCRNPDQVESGIAVFSNRIVGFEWSCRAEGGRLSLGGREVRFDCQAEGNPFQSRYQLIGNSERAMLVEDGKLAEAVGLIDCSSVGEAPEVFETRGVLNGRSDVLSEDGSFYQDFTVDLKRGHHISVELFSGDFDAYLFVTGPEFGEQNDDGGDGTNAAIEFVAPRSGTYTVRVNTYGPGEVGHFVVRVTSVKRP